MACYAIGDVQGCRDELARLLDQLRFDPARDEIWFVGDLVNRGPRSLETLRLVRSLGERCTVVLGNHDLHLIALAMGNPARRREADLAAVLEAPDGAELVDWLRHRPLAHYRPELGTLMVHAGVPPQWDPLTTVKLAREAEQVLQGPRCREFLAVLYGNRPDRWNPVLSGFDRLRFIINALTRIRFCRPDGSLDLDQKGPPAGAPPSLTPWFRFPARASATVRVVFGHWSTLGLLQTENLLGLDTGCVWGGSLTAVRLDGPTRIWQVPSPGYQSPGGD
jgi:bis(5'-nucleosyl)-tetraphosphatase (symmetrical)